MMRHVALDTLVDSRCCLYLLVSIHIWYMNSGSTVTVCVGTVG